jgi:hypothetical protein
MSDETKFYTDRQLCERWHCTPMTLYRMRQKGVLRKPTKLLGEGSTSRNLTPDSEVRRLEGDNASAAS